MAHAAKRYATLQGPLLTVLHIKDDLTQCLKIITVGDCSRAETQVFFRERILPGVPEHLRDALVFEKLYAAFGGKLAHWQDYVTDFGEFISC